MGQNPFFPFFLSRRFFFHSFFRKVQCPTCKQFDREHWELLDQSQSTTSSLIGFTNSSLVSLLQQENATLQLQNRQLTIQTRISNEEANSLVQKVRNWQAQLTKTKAKLSFLTWKIYRIVEKVYTAEPRNVVDAEVEMAEVLHQTLTSVLAKD